MTTLSLLRLYKLLSLLRIDNFIVFSSILILVTVIWLWTTYDSSGWVDKLIDLIFTLPDPRPFLLLPRPSLPSIEEKLQVHRTQPGQVHRVSRLFQVKHLPTPCSGMIIFFIHHSTLHNLQDLRHCYLHIPIEFIHLLFDHGSLLLDLLIVELLHDVWLTLGS